MQIFISFPGTPSCIGPAKVKRRGVAGATNNTPAILCFQSCIATALARQPKLWATIQTFPVVFAISALNTSAHFSSSGESQSIPVTR